MGARCDTMYRPEAAGVSAAATCAAATSRTSQMMGVPSAALPSISPWPAQAARVSQAVLAPRPPGNILGPC